MHLRNADRDLANEDLLLFQMSSFAGRKNYLAKIASTSRFTNFKILKDNWVNSSNKYLRMHMFLKSCSDLTPKPLPTHSLIADNDSALQSTNTPNSSTQVANDHSSNFDHLNETSINNSTTNTPLR